jgi:hypothetical protein
MFDTDAAMLDVRATLQRLNKRFPEQIETGIRAALHDEKTRADMLAQILRLCASSSLDWRGLEVRMEQGNLLYSDRTGFVGWGAKAFRCAAGYKMASGVSIIGGEPCWIERSAKQERVAWGGRVGKAYPVHSIGHPIECAKRPCYAVNVQDAPNGPVGFVVVDETELPRFRGVRDLTVSNGYGSVFYVATTASGEESWMCDHEMIAAGYRISRPAVCGHIPHVAVQFSNQSYRAAHWIWNQRREEADRIHGPSTVGGKLAIALQGLDAGRRETNVMIGSESAIFAGTVMDWYPVGNAENAAAVVFSVRGADDNVRTFANFTELRQGRPEANAVSLDEDGVALRVRFEGGNSAEPFDLKKLGIL